MVALSYNRVNGFVQAARNPFFKMPSRSLSRAAARNFDAPGANTPDTEIPGTARGATLQDVARAAGVAPITASRALSDPRKVAAETLERVQRAVQATGYIPNRLAGGLKSRRSLTVGALVPYVAVPQFLPTLQALTEQLDAAGYQLVLGQTGYDHAREAALIDTLLGRRVDAIVSMGLLNAGSTGGSGGSGTTGGVAARLSALGVPLVETWDLSDSPTDTQVGFSHLAVGAAVAGYFLGKGWREVGLATGDDERALRRCAGFAAAFGGDVARAVIQAPSSLALGRAALAELLADARFADRPLRAVFCSSDGMAQGVLTEARARGLNVPRDLAVVGFGGADFAAHLLPALSTVQIDAAAIGRLAAAQVLARCAQSGVGVGVAARAGEVQVPPQRRIDVGFSIVERESSAA